MKCVLVSVALTVRIGEIFARNSQVLTLYRPRVVCPSAIIIQAQHFCQVNPTNSLSGRCQGLNWPSVDFNCSIHDGVLTLTMTAAHTYYSQLSLQRFITNDRILSWCTQTPNSYDTNKIFMRTHHEVQPRA